MAASSELPLDFLGGWGSSCGPWKGTRTLNPGARRLSGRSGEGEGAGCQGRGAGARTPAARGPAPQCTFAPKPEGHTPLVGVLWPHVMRDEVRRGKMSAKAGCHGWSSRSRGRESLLSPPEASGSGSGSGSSRSTSPVPARPTALVASTQDCNSRPAVSQCSLRYQLCLVRIPSFILFICSVSSLLRTSPNSNFPCACSWD